MRNLYYLTDIALDTFESRKAELKMMVSMRFGFYIYAFIFSPFRLYTGFRDLSLPTYHMFPASPQNCFFSNKNCYKNKKYEFAKVLLLPKLQMK